MVTQYFSFICLQMMMFINAQSLGIKYSTKYSQGVD